MSAALSLLAAGWAMDLWHADLRAPFNYEGDALFHTMLIKIMVENGWYEHTTALGAPAGLMLQDFPAADNLSCAIIKALSLFTTDPVFLSNIFFLVTFPLTALSALFVARRFGLSAGVALLVSFLYTLLPYHFFRGTVHLFYSAYFLVPPVILVAWWVSSGSLLAHRRRIWFSFGLCALLGCNMVYYPFFGCFLLMVATVMSLARRDIPHVLTGGLLIATVTIVLILNLLPNILYLHAHGSASIGKRFSWEAESAGLKITQLLLPTTGHRVPALARLKAGYNDTHPLVNENDWVSLGLVGSAGFLILMGWVLFIRPATGPRADGQPVAGAANPLGTVIEHLSVFNASAILLGTIGGFSVLFAVLISPQIRGYNRICVFIAYYSLLTVGVALEWLGQRWVTSRRKAIFCGGALAVLGLLGYLDQTGADAYRDWPALRRNYRNDKQFFARVQRSLPPGSMVFELPYEPFPEYGQTINEMTEYAPFRPYLLTHGLRWSYGAIKGRAGDFWEKGVAALPLAQMVATLERDGFAAIYIDRSAYVDHGAALEASLANFVVAAPISDVERRFSLFKLATPLGPPPSLDSILPLVLPQWAGGFYGLEESPDHKINWRWCAADGEMHLRNDSKVVRHLRLQATMKASSPAPTALHVTSPVLQAELLLDPAKRTPFSYVIDWPPGDTVIRFHCDGKALPVDSTDPRTLVWSIENFTLEDADPGLPVPSNPTSLLPAPSWAGGFHELEASANKQKHWRWCAAGGDLKLHNDTTEIRRVRVEGILGVASPAPAGLQVSSPGWNQSMVINPSRGTFFSHIFALVPGETVIHFRCDGIPLPISPTESRTLVWRLINCTIEDAP